MATRRLGGIATSSSVPDNGGDHSGGGGSGGGYVDDVFSVDLWSTASMNEDASIDNGVDLAGGGGMIWLKNRDATGNNTLFDSERGLQYGMYTDGPDAQWDTESLGFTAPTFNEGGYTTGTANAYTTAGDHVGWTWRKAPKFFDVVTYTGTGVARDIPHNLGVEPGMIIVKNTTSSSDWPVYHQSRKGIDEGQLNQGGYGFVWNAGAFFSHEKISDKTFGVTTRVDSNADGDEYVAYVFAHDESDESMIKCGSYAGNGSIDGPEIDLGFEPQWLLFKNTAASSNWMILDCMRGIVSGGDDSTLAADDSGAENGVIGKTDAVRLLPNGFKLTGSITASNAPSGTHIFMAVRRPNKPAEEFEPEELFAISPRTASPEKYPYVSNLPVDMGMSRIVTSSTEMRIGSRMIGDKYLQTENSSAEARDETWGWWDDMRSAGLGNTLKDAPERVGWMWRRAPHFVDVVCYEGDGQPNREIPHSLGVKPEMVILKSRSKTTSWAVYNSSAWPKCGYFHLNKAFAENVTPMWFSDVEPDESVFTIGDVPDVNGSSEDYIAYLFASVPGICDIGSYTGNGGNVDVDCGFTNGARFVLIKRTDADGDWMLFDTLRGIVEGNSKKLNLNDTAAQVGGRNYIAPYSKGFQAALADTTTIVGATYIYYAIA